MYKLTKISSMVGFLLLSSAVFSAPIQDHGVKVDVENHRQLVLFVNGIANTEHCSGQDGKATHDDKPHCIQRGKKWLKPSELEEMKTEASDSSQKLAEVMNYVNTDVISYDYFYNPTDGDKTELYVQGGLSNESLKNIKAGFKSPMSITDEQKHSYYQHLGKAYQEIYRQHQNEKNTAKKRVAETTFRLVTQIKKYLEQDKFATIVLVPHSQGNFYVESAYAWLVAEGRDDLTSRIRVVGVAPVAATSPNDVYILDVDDRAVNDGQTILAGFVNSKYHPLSPNVNSAWYNITWSNSNNGNTGFWGAIKNIFNDINNNIANNIINHNFIDFYLNDKIVNNEEIRKNNKRFPFIEKGAKYPDVIRNFINTANEDLRKQHIEPKVVRTAYDDDKKKIKIVFDKSGFAKNTSISDVWLTGSQRNYTGIYRNSGTQNGNFEEWLVSLPTDFSTTDTLELNIQYSKSFSSLHFYENKMPITVAFVTHVSSLPVDVKAGETFELIIEGKNLPTQKLIVEGCQNQTTKESGIFKALTASRHSYYCTAPSAPQSMVMTVKNLDGTRNYQFGKEIHDNTPVSTITVTNITTQPQTIKAGLAFIMRVYGQNLPTDKMLTVNGCNNQNQVSLAQNQHVYRCVAPNTGTNFTLSVLGLDGNTLLKTQTIPLQASTTPPRKMPITGISFCADASSFIACSLLPKDWIGLGQDGELQKGYPMSYSLHQNGNDSCVIDELTGLMWEQKTDDNGLRDKDNRYTWYNPRSLTNGGNAGHDGTGKNTCQGSSCNTQDYITKLNASNYCGYNDWRLPDYYELSTIVDYGGRSPSINAIFLGMNKESYWTSATNPQNSSHAWCVSFDSGYGSNGCAKDNSYNIRAVRSGN